MHRKKIIPNCLKMVKESIWNFIQAYLIICLAYLKKKNFFFHSKRMILNKINRKFILNKKTLFLVVDSAYLNVSMPLVTAGSQIKMQEV